MAVHAGCGRLEAHVGPGRPASRGSSGEQGAWACWLWRREPQHHAAWGGAGAGVRLAPAVGKPRCSRIARTAPACFTYAKSRRRPPHLTQANTSKSNLLLSTSAQSTPDGLSFIGSLLAAASSATLASSSPAWGTRNG